MGHKTKCFISKSQYWSYYSKKKVLSFKYFEQCILSVKNKYDKKSGKYFENKQIGSHENIFIGRDISELFAC